MKRKLLAMVCAVSMIASMGAATVYAEDEVKATGDEKIALITMDSIDQHWITLNEGAQAEDGYAFYRLDFQVTNEGDETRYMDNYYGIYFNEDNGRYNDVLDWWGTEEEESRPRFLFEDYDYTYLPAGRICTYQMVVQILDGVKSFTVDYYPGDVSGERISFEMTIE